MGYDSKEKVFLRSVGEAVRATREKVGWSQEELGFQSGVHRTYIGAIERGERNISLLSLRKVAIALKVPISLFLSFERNAKN